MFNKNKRTKKFSDLLIPGIILIIIGDRICLSGNPGLQQTEWGSAQSEYRI